MFILNILLFKLVIRVKDLSIGRISHHTLSSECLVKFNFELHRRTHYLLHAISTGTRLMLKRLSLVKKTNFERTKHPIIEAACIRD